MDRGKIPERKFLILLMLFMSAFAVQPLSEKQRHKSLGREKHDFADYDNSNVVYTFFTSKMFQDTNEKISKWKQSEISAKCSNAILTKHDKKKRCYEMEIYPGYLF